MLMLYKRFNLAGNNEQDKNWLKLSKMQATYLAIDFNSQFSIPSLFLFLSLLN